MLQTSYGPYAQSNNSGVYPPTYSIQTAPIMRQCSNKSCVYASWNLYDFRIKLLDLWVHFFLELLFEKKIFLTDKYLGSYTSDGLNNACRSLLTIARTNQQIFMKLPTSLTELLHTDMQTYTATLKELLQFFVANALRKRQCIHTTVQPSQAT